MNEARASQGEKITALPPRPSRPSVFSHTSFITSLQCRIESNYGLNVVAGKVHTCAVAADRPTSGRPFVGKRAGKPAFICRQYMCIYNVHTWWCGATIEGLSASCNWIRLSNVQIGAH